MDWMERSVCVRNSRAWFMRMREISENIVRPKTCLKGTSLESALDIVLNKQFGKSISKNSKPPDYSIYPFMLTLGSNQVVPAFILQAESRSIWPAPAKSFRFCSSVSFQPLATVGKAEDNQSFHPINTQIKRACSTTILSRHPCPALGSATKLAR